MQYYPAYSASLGLEGHLAQRYLRPPLLLEGCKFNCRVYLWIASVAPLLLFFHGGYVTRALLPFDLADTHATLRHVSNTRLQKEHPSFAAKKEDQKWDWDRFAAHLVQAGHLPSLAHFQEGVEGRMRHCLGALFRHLLPRLDSAPGRFGLYGVDFLFEADTCPVLIEINKAPSHSASHHEGGPDLVALLLEEVLATQLHLLKGGQPPLPIHRWQPITLPQ